MKNINYKLIEFFILFLIIPISFLVEFLVVFKIGIGFLGFVYILFVLFRIEGNTVKISKNIDWKYFWKTTLLRLIIIGIITAFYVWLITPENLFTVIKTKPLLWGAILFFYSVFSVYPQELIYRTFFFQRYQSLFKNQLFFILTNAVLFSLAHIFFKNTMVLLLTFIGGILFAFTYKKTKSTLLVSIEHSIYGCWLFTVGMGEMLGFPT
ncbi:MAG: CPBP family intramembrane glutamic endopeptidase [Polaribacter sp.]